MVTIYHNPRCSKSRQTLALLEEKGVIPIVHLYLEEPMPQQVLEKALTTLGDQAVRKGETEYKEHIKGKGLEGADLAKAMLEYPKTIERPLVTNGPKMALGRPPEAVLDIL